MANSKTYAKRIQSLARRGMDDQVLFLFFLHLQDLCHQNLSLDRNTPPLFFLSAFHYALQEVGSDSISNRFQQQNLSCIVKNLITYLSVKGDNFILIMIRLALFVILALTVIQSYSYSTSLAHDLAHLQSISYQTQSDIDNWNCEQCKNYDVLHQKSFFSSSANIQGYVAYSIKQSAIIVTFRGSVDIKNWLFNLNTVTTSYPSCSGCSVHLGFYSAYKGAAPIVRSALEPLFKLYRDANLIITGHSLGGAMAVLCALDMKQSLGKTSLLYSFGQPRVGNQNFANYLQKEIPQYYRVINFADTVPHVPQSVLGFKHGGNQIWYNPRGMKNFKQCVSEDKSCSNSVALTSMSTEDHHLINYMELEIVNIQRGSAKTEGQKKAIYYTDEQVSYAQSKKIDQIKQLILLDLKR